MPHHCLDRDAFFQKLLSLVERGWLDVHYGPRLRLPISEMQSLRESGWIETDKSPDVILDRRCAFQKLQQASSPSSDLRGYLRLGLTPAGGSQWEQFARPRWYLFVDDRGRRMIDGRAHLVIRTRTRRMAFFISELLQHLGWRLHPEPIHSISQLASWEPIYWKRFSQGYQILIDLQVGAESPTAEAYQEGFYGVENPAEDIMAYACSLWDLEFWSRLKELRFRIRRY